MTRSRAVALVTLALTASCSNNPTVSNVKIVGGVPTQVPAYFAALHDMGSTRPFCGGTFVAPRVVVTAAHCVVGQTTTLAVTPRPEQSLPEFFKKPIRVEAVLAHPEFDRSTMDNDIAILFLEEYNRADYPAITPIPMNTEDTFPASTDTMSVSGYGNSTSFGNYFQPTFMSVNIPQLPAPVCETHQGYQGKVTDNQICGGDLDKGGVDSCQGDSGGPLVATDARGQTRLIGVVSWGIGCATPKAPGIYTRVSKYTDFVNSVVSFQRGLKSPFDDQTASLATLMNCYDKFKARQVTEDKQGVLVFNLQLSPSDVFGAAGEQSPGLWTSIKNTVLGWFGAKNQNSELLVDAKEVPSISRCEIGAETGRLTVSAMITKSRSAVLVATDSVTSDRFVAPTTSANSFVIRCKSEDGNLLAFSSAQGIVLANTTMYEPFFEASEIPTSYPVSSCQVGESKITVALNDDQGKPLDVAYARLESPYLGGQPMIVAMMPRSASSEEIAPVNVKVETADDGQGTLTIENQSDSPIFTWNLTCSFEGTLIAPDGSRHASQYYVADYAMGESRSERQRWAFDSASQRWSDLAPQSSLTMTFDTPIYGTELDSCHLNGKKVNLTFARK